MRTAAPVGPSTRAVPLTLESAVIRSAAESARPSPSGEIDVGVTLERITGAFRSTVTTFWTDARLFEASAVQIVMRYGPSGTREPSDFVPFHVYVTALL